eukprot:CAMPEP_0182537876 /NCGR_PEP_ID=MMETSP1323-20130603/22716_1 /TAXON_ID=236787 /ORGANISM="Florenciella parvula, Strain RCC1693" /LENGTH=501 /DNA_ID=CAMNT_0024748301 /DNA_START=63 /DNA_END=1568 /DNA_ORIENTATION=-
MSLRIAILAATVPAAALADVGTVYAGYSMATDCDKHANIAYDAKDLKSCLTVDDGADTYTAPDGTAYTTWEECAMAVYENGFNSCKSGTSAVQGGTGCTAFRTLQAFSTAAESKFTVSYGQPATLRNEVAWQFYKYYGSWTWGDDWMQAATDQTGVWASTSAWDGVMGDAENARKQATKKGAGFIVNQMYAMYEYHRRANQAYNAMTGNTTVSSTEKTYSMVHGWDEGWAFFAGALESGSGDSGIDWGLTLAEKRDGSFDTNTATYNPNGGESTVNAKMLAASQIGRDALNPFDNATNAGAVVWDAWKCIEQQAFIPMIQGCLLYMYKSDVCTADCGDAYGEMYTFCSAMVPILNAANPTDAGTLMDYVSPDKILATGLPQTYATMSALIYDNLNDMGLKVAEVGACTYCGNKLSDYDTTGDSAVSNKCGFAFPVDETASTDDTADDDDDDCKKKDKAAPAVLAVGVVCMFLGAAFATFGLVKFNAAKAGAAVPTAEMSKV